eukprot:363901-Chlamydomonas_euryale.AAC.7
MIFYTCHLAGAKLSEQETLMRQVTQARETARTMLHQVLEAQGMQCEEGAAAGSCNAADVHDDGPELGQSIASDGGGTRDWLAHVHGRVVDVRAELDAICNFSFSRRVVDTNDSVDYTQPPATPDIAGMHTPEQARLPPFAAFLDDEEQSTGQSVWNVHTPQQRCLQPHFILPCQHGGSAGYAGIQECTPVHQYAGHSRRKQTIGGSSTATSVALCSSSSSSSNNNNNSNNISNSNSNISTAINSAAAAAHSSRSSFTNVHTWQRYPVSDAGLYSAEFVSNGTCHAQSRGIFASSQRAAGAEFANPIMVNPPLGFSNCMLRQHRMTGSGPEEPACEGDCASGSGRRTTSAVHAIRHTTLESERVLHGVHNLGHTSSIHADGKNHSTAEVPSAVVADDFRTVEQQEHSSWQDMHLHTYVEPDDGFTAVPKTPTKYHKSGTFASICRVLSLGRS